MEKKSFVSKQIAVILWLLMAAISAIEGLKQFQTGGATNPWFYLMLGVFIVSAYMYFTRKNKRLDTPDKK